MAETFSGFIETRAQLRAIYDQPSNGAVAKEIGRIDAHCRRFIEMSPFLCMGTTGEDGAGDVSPRGDAPGFVQVVDEGHLAIPDRPGNNRLDSLTNILARPDVGLLFFIPGFEDMLRVNGTARISVDRALMQRFIVRDKLPRAVILVAVREAQLHCTKAIKRAELWNPSLFAERRTFPSAGQILRDHIQSEAQVAAIDAFVQKDARENLY